jgi:hypothetical protein
MRLTRRCLVTFLSGLLLCGPPVPIQASRVEQQEAELTIAAVGDVMMGSTYPDSRLPSNDGADLLDDFAPLLTGADISFANLEGPLLEGGESPKCRTLTSGIRSDGANPDCYAFRVPPRFGARLKQAGFGVVSLANNHADDFGVAGRSSTRAVLDKFSIRYAGGDQRQFAATIVGVKGKRIGFVAFASNDISPNVNDIQSARSIVAQLKSRVDIVVVSFHGGAEGAAHQHVPAGPEQFLGEQRGNLRIFTHAVIDAGADLVLGHGPHVMRAMELYRQRLIVYSMGNFCTYGRFHLAGPTALTAVFLIHLAPDGTCLGGRVYPGRQEGEGGPHIDPSGEAIRLVRQLSTSDFGSNAPEIADDGSFAPRLEM